MVKNNSDISKKKNRNLFQVLGLLVILVLINVITSKVFFRFDLTSDHRYSLTGATINELNNLDDIIFIRVYLDGELPANYKRLKEATKEILDEFRAYSDQNIEYEFINPSESDDEKTRRSIYQELTKQGLQYNNIRFKEGDTYSEKIIFPGAIFSYQGRELPIQLLKSQMGSDETSTVNNSIQQLEYELASIIKKLLRYKPLSIAFIEGHGELNEFETVDIVNALSDQYSVSRVRIDGKLEALRFFDAAVIAGSKTAWNEKDKFVLDQFIMNGGKTIWLVENVHASMDSLKTANTTMGVPIDVNLNDILFKYGVRVNSDLIQDLQSRPIPIITGYSGNQPKQEFFPWLFYPLSIPTGDHPIIKNLDALKTEFVSTIDTLGVPNIKKTILLTSSEYSKVIKTPTRISLNMLREEPDNRQFTRGKQTFGVLLEGTFTSNFKNRIPPQIARNIEINYRETSSENKMIVISDADLMRNQYNPASKEYYALGFDKFTNRTYSNKELFLNSFNYLLDESGLIEARTKEFKIRVLDSTKVSSEKGFWQIINTGIPIVMIVLFGMAQFYVRRKKYGLKK
jgi:ABC-2 type transport system permease protein|tara:strand:- start:2747 stop:4459 length:1713 start_codon:yes stop_codon:yes gene_type:complete